MAALMRKFYERVCAAEATVAAVFLILMVILIPVAIVCIPLMLLAVPVMLCFGLCKFAWHA